MPIQLTTADWRAIFPRAPQEVIDAFAAKQGVLDKAGITATRMRLSYFLANIEHECGGFSIPNLTENINYTAARMAKVWQNRFSGAAAVQARYGTGKGWQLRAFDDIYGNRMGNRPGTDDGSRYIGRGGPQWTGRDGYAALERLTGLPAVLNPAVASRLDMQPEICAAFWTWKNLNRFADVGDFTGCVRAWNGGTNGMADRKTLMAGNDPIIARLGTAMTIEAVLPKPVQPPVTAPNKPAGAGAAAVAGAVVIANGTAVAVNQGVSAMDIIMWIGGATALAVVIFIIGYRIVKGTWPWTGNQSQEPSSPLPLNSEPSSEQLSLDRSALRLAALQAPPLPPPSELKKPRKRSAAPSRKTRTPRAKSSKSKPSAVRKSSPKRRLKSKR